MAFKKEQTNPDKYGKMDKNCKHVSISDMITRTFRTVPIQDQDYPSSIPRSKVANATEFLTGMESLENRSTGWDLYLNPRVDSVF